MPAIIERRELIAALAGGGGVAPLAVCAQEAAMPVVGIHAVASRSSRTTL
jgi:hypothetical protein